MKNNINNLISEELKKATLLFNYDTQKTLSENIEEQTNTGFTAPNLSLNQNSGLNVSSIRDMLKNFQSAASSTTNGQNPSPEDFTKMFQSLGKNIPSPEEFSKKLQSMTNKSPEEMSKMFQSMIAGGTSSSGTTSGTTSGTSAPTSVLITKNDNAYEYKMENGKYYFKGKTGTKFATKYPDWREAKAQKGIDAIKALFDKNPKGDTPVESSTPPTDNTEKYKEFFAQKLKDAQNLPKTIFGTQGGETPKQPNDGIVDDNAAANNTGQIQGTISDDEEL